MGGRCGRRTQHFSSSDVDEEFMHFSGAEFCECVHAVSLIFESLFQTLFRVVQQNLQRTLTFDLI